MFQRFKYPVLVLTLVWLFAFSTASPSKAESLASHRMEATPYDLINAVNALRASNGLPAYAISPILMFTAQSQADFMAATEDVTHVGAGGTTVTDRLLAAGYPLAGDLSLGGFRSENIIGGLKNMSAQEAVNAWTGDAPHLTTMLSPNLTEIGAGVAVSNGRVYYVIDAAHPTTSTASQVGSTVSVSGSTVPAIEATVNPVTVSTPDVDGNVIHEVKTGQSLWQIAIDYGVKIDEIKRLNNLADNNIFPGEKLLIKKAVATLVSPTLPPEPELTSSPTALPIETVTASVTATMLQTALPPSIRRTAAENNVFAVSVIGILIVALVGGGLFVLLGNAKEK